jgi:site-specific DNA-methyltransferase (adenine-specific)
VGDEVSSEIKLFNMDCMEAMKQMPDKAFDLAIVDPPYGIGMSKNAHSNLSHIKNKEWDLNIPHDTYFNNLFRVSKNQIIWGGNYFTLPPTRGFIFWDKHPMPPSYAHGEYAWTSFSINAKKWSGKVGNDVAVKDRIHQTQKPVKLYLWLLNNYAKPNDKILDTHLGSGSIAIACYDMGFDLTGYEIDKDYYDAAVNRLENNKKQLTLF